MSNLRQAAELALEIIETHHGEFDYANEITALRAALAEPEQEPVAWEQFYPDIGKPQLRQEPSITKTGCGILTLHLGFDDLPDGTKFYTTPPKRPWVGLTDEQISQLWISTSPYFNEDDFARAVEAKLKELNT